MSKSWILSVARPLYREMNERFGAGTMTKRQAIESAVDSITEYMQG